LENQINLLTNWFEAMHKRRVKDSQKKAVASVALLCDAKGILEEYPKGYK
jgi:hypothetical protein